MADRQKGFSLIELLIVVAIIMIVTAIAVANFLRARLAANETSAVSSIRSINTAAVTYSSTYPNDGYPASLAALGGPASACVASNAQACLLDTVLVAGTKSGYTFIWTGDGNTPSVGYSITGNPVALDTTGVRGFYSDDSGVIRYQVGAPATVASPALQ